MAAADVKWITLPGFCRLDLGACRRNTSGKDRAEPRIKKAYLV